MAHNTTLRGPTEIFLVRINLAPYHLALYHAITVRLKPDRI